MTFVLDFYDTLGVHIQTPIDLLQASDERIDLLLKVREGLF